MRTLLSFAFCFMLFNSFSQQTSNTIKGVITYGDYPLVNASIVIKGTSQGVESSINGKYEIEARPREMLVFSYVGMQTVEIMVEEVTQTLNLSMVRKVEELDEVVVTKRKRMTQKDMAIDYPINNNIIKTGFGYINKETAGHAMKVIEGSVLNNAAIDILTALDGKYPGAGKGMIYDEVKGKTEEVFGFGRSGFPAIFEIDGQVFTSAPTWLDLASIERVALIPSLSFAVKYGQIAKGGVVVINTKNAGNSVHEAETGKPYDRAKLRDNLFKNDALSQTSVLKNEALYLKELYQSKTKEEALAVYEKHKVNYGDSYFFIIDAYRFFMERIEDKGVANGIITTHEDLFMENPVALKALAYVHQANGAFNKANELYKETFILRPNYAQSYMDLANSYRELGDGKKAASLYMRYDYLVNKGFLEKDSTAFAQIMDHEFNNLMLKGNEIFSKEAKTHVLEEDFNGTRLVFEWNDSEAEFELQFVNPEGRYFKTVHSMAKDAERIRDEKLLGYSCEEFLIDESLTGTWQVNAKYLGNKSLTPSYLKATIYYDYGSGAQRKEIKVIKLGLKNVNQELFKVNNTPSITSN